MDADGACSRWNRSSPQFRPTCSSEAVQDHRYAPYVERQQSEIARLRADEAVRIPADLDYRGDRRALERNGRAAGRGAPGDAGRGVAHARNHAGGAGRDPGSRPPQGGMMDEDERAPGSRETSMFHVKQWSGSTPSSSSVRGRESAPESGLGGDARARLDAPCRSIRRSFFGSRRADGRVARSWQRRRLSRAWSSRCCTAAGDAGRAAAAARRFPSQRAVERLGLATASRSSARAARAHRAAAVRRHQRPRVRAARPLARLGAAAFPQTGHASGCFPRAEMRKSELEAARRFVAG